MAVLDLRGLVGSSLVWGSLCRLLLWSTGSKGVDSAVVAPWFWSTGSVLVARRFSCSAACGILPDQGWKTCPLHGKAYSLVRNHQYHRATRKASLLVSWFQFKACCQHLLKSFSPFTNVKFPWGGVEDSNILL